MSAPVALLAAVARNGVIGGDNTLPWRLSSDLKRFRALTMGKPVIMGRKTFASLKRPLPGREVIVITRDGGFAAADAAVAASPDAALALAQRKAQASGASEIIIAGGGEIYAQMMAGADRLYITYVDCAPAGDAKFPNIHAALWREVLRTNGVRGDKDEAEFVFVDYERRG